MLLALPAKPRIRFETVVLLRDDPPLGDVEPNRAVGQSFDQLGPDVGIDRGEDLVLDIDHGDAVLLHFAELADAAGLDLQVGAALPLDGDVVGVFPLLADGDFACGQAKRDRHVFLGSSVADASAHERSPLPSAEMRTIERGTPTARATCSHPPGTGACSRLS